MDYTSPDLSIWLDKDSKIRSLKRCLADEIAKSKALEEKVFKLNKEKTKLERLIGLMKRTQKKLRYRNRKLRKIADTKKIKRSDIARKMIIDGAESKSVAKKCFLSIKTVYTLKSKLKKEGKLK